MESLKLYEHSEFGTLSVLPIDGKELFPATDCAEMLGYVNPYDAIQRHCKEDALVKHEVTDSIGKCVGKPF